MSTVTMEEMERDPARYLRLVEQGEALLLTHGDQPLAEIKPVAVQPRPYGLAKGTFTVPDDFDDPLPDDVLKLFEIE